MAEEKTELSTVEINGLEVFQVGTWNGDKYSLADLQAMVAAFNDVGFEPTVKIGHEDGQEDPAVSKRLFGEPALGYVKQIYLDGLKLIADLHKVPRRIADLIKAGTYKRVSAEIYWDFIDGLSKKKWPRVLKSIAFLGADIPALPNLKAIEALFNRDDSGRLIAYDDNDNEYRTYDFAALKTYYIKKKGDQWCVCAESGKELGCHDTEEKAKAQLRAVEANKDKDEYTKAEEICDSCVKEKSNQDNKEIRVTSKSGGAKMEQSEIQKMVDEAVSKALEVQSKEHAEELKYKTMRAREDGKAEILKDKAELEESIRLLQAEKRSERIEHWLKTMKSEGKILPAEEAKVRAMREWIPDEGPGLKFYSIKAGKSVEEAMSPADLFESLFSSRAAKFFKELSGAGEEIPELAASGEYTDAGTEVDRRAKAYQQAMQEKNTKVTYADAVSVVLKKDGALAQRYNAGHVMQ